MELKVEGNDPVRDPDETDLRDAVRELDGQGQRFVILSVDDQTYIQTTGRPDQGYILEYRDGSPDAHYQSKREDLARSQIEEAFVSYAQGDEDWREQFEWEAWETQNQGCLSVLIAPVGLSFLS